MTIKILSLILLLFVLTSCYHKVRNNLDYIKYCEGVASEYLSDRQARECVKFENQNGWK